MDARPGLDRRGLLRSGAAALGGAGLGWVAAAGALPDRAPARPEGTGPGGMPAPAGAAPPPGRATVAFHGVHQAGIRNPAPSFLSLLGLNLNRGTDAATLIRLMRLLSDDASRLTRGLPALADTEPELAMQPASLTVTFGFGPRVTAELVPQRRGLVTPLPPFSTDRLESQWGQTDLAVQICADDPVTLAHTRRMLLKDAAPFTRTRWIQDGYRYAHGIVPSGTTMRNLMGQVDGTVNPAPTDADYEQLMWSTQPGFEGGTTMVVRRIRAEMEAWDGVDRVGRELVMGRRLDTGAPLTGTREFDPPDFEALDEMGFPVIDPASHIARARTDDPMHRFLRRPYNYSVPDPSRPSGEDAGLVFIAFAADLERQFVPVQRRLAELDRLNRYTTAIGSAVYAVPPGPQDGEFVGERMLGE